jgi:hypothetical protein
MKEQTSALERAIDRIESDIAGNPELLGISSEQANGGAATSNTALVVHGSSPNSPLERRMTDGRRVPHTGAVKKNESRHSLALQYRSEGPISDIVEKFGRPGAVAAATRRTDCRTEPLRALEVDNEMIFLVAPSHFNDQRPSALRQDWTAHASLKR